MSPLLLELHTRRWLAGLSLRAKRKVTLPTVPEAELDGWTKLGFTHIWLMGAWRSGPQAREVARSSPGIVQACGSLENVGASPYAIAAYEIPASYGGERGLAAFRERLHARGMRLILDFVPNHAGLDHPWAASRPELFVQSQAPTPLCFRRQSVRGSVLLAHGKDPFFPPWTDTIQFDYRLTETHRAMTQVLLGIADKCDGVRCDMAMLVLREVFQNTWREYPATGNVSTEEEFWPAAIAAVRNRYPHFMFLAEAYWGLEPRLQQMGFDYTYDKTLYDHLIRDQPGRAVAHVSGATRSFLEHSAHFLENHDEPRIAATLDHAYHKVAALLTFSLPGLRFLHEGQLSGARVRLPVQALLPIAEEPDPDLERFYRDLLCCLPAVGQGRWSIVDFSAVGPTINPIPAVLLAWEPPGDIRFVIGLNLAIERLALRARLNSPGAMYGNGRFECLYSVGECPRITAEPRLGQHLLELPGRSGAIWRMSLRC